MEFRDEEFLPLSGIQHFAFCRRQWALIHIEQQWAENYRTVDGSLMHKKVHDKSLRESRGDRFITRGMSVFSRTIGVSGECDALEFHRNSGGIPLEGREGLWMPYPVEYKRGSPNEKSGDLLQVCCQAMCLEEMLCCPIPEGALYYGEIRRRVAVDFTDELRQLVRSSLEEMHQLYQRGYTPRVKPTKSCKACSLNELCLPILMSQRSVTEYLRGVAEEIE